MAAEEDFAEGFLHASLGHRPSKMLHLPVESPGPSVSWQLMEVDIPVGLTRWQAAPGGATPAGPLPEATAAAQGEGQNRVVMRSGRKKLYLFITNKKTPQALSIPWESYLGMRDAKSKTF